MKMLTIQQWFKANATFSFVCAIDLFVFPSVIATWMGLSPAWVLQVMAVGLVAFASYVWMLGRRRDLSKNAGLQIIAADTLWVMGSIILVILNPWRFTTLGLSLIIMIAAIVGVFAVGQVFALKRHCDISLLSQTSKRR